MEGRQQPRPQMCYASLISRNRRYPCGMNMSRAVQSKYLMLFIALLAIAFVGLLDYYTGRDLLLSILYLIPILFVTWYVGLWAGVLASAVSAIALYVSNYLFIPYREQVIAILNMLVAFLTFLLVAYLFCRLRQAIERQQQLARELEHRAAEQEDFLHIVSHDLRVPLTVIRGYAELLESVLVEAEVSDETVRQSLMAIMSSTQQMNAMIQDLVDATRFAGGSLTLTRAPLLLGPYLADLLTRWQTVLDIQRVTLDIPPDLPPVYADSTRLERIILNLLTNALKYSQAGAPIVLQACHRDNEVVISVTDQGPGIPPEDLPHLFERFYRGKGAHRAEGIGLGLYITGKLVEAHGLPAEAGKPKVGGTIRVESEVGKGSTFSFTLPVAG